MLRWFDDEWTVITDGYRNDDGTLPWCAAAFLMVLGKGSANAYAERR